MTFLDGLLAAFRALRVNILRSVLTTLGIIIGVGAVITMVSVGSGAQERVDRLIESIGSNLLIVVPGSRTSGGVHLGAGSNPTLTIDDADAIRDEIPAVIAAAPSVSGSAQIVFGNRNWLTQVRGIRTDYMVAREWAVSDGRTLQPDVVAGGAKVALVGTSVAAELFGGGDPVGQTIRIKRIPFEVVGVLGAKGQTTFGRDLDDVVFIPLTTAKRRVLGGRNLGGRTVANIAIKTATAEAVGPVEDRVAELMRVRHDIRPGALDDFRIRNITEILSARAESSRVMTLLLAAVASVSLLVGGIGIMNIMLVSVTERTREIGIRMALGARGRDILSQFLVEALTLSLIGGLIGTVAGIAASQAIANLAEWPLRLEPGAVVLAISFSAAVGVFFGYYPAREAARLNPIEALRYE